MPELIIEKFKKKIKPIWKLCFIYAVIFGIVAHIYKITNWLPNWDSLVFRYDPQNMLALGRWFLPVVCSPSSFYDLPWLTGIFAILLCALGAVYICRIFDVKNNITAAFIGALVVTFPTVTSVLLYNYVADGYSLSFLFSVLAVFCLTKEKPNYILSALFIAFSVGIYQAYITVTVMLILCYLIYEVLNSRLDIRSLIVKSLKFMLTGICGMLLYYIILIVLLKITKTSLLEYQGIDSSVSLESINLRTSMYVVVHSFLGYFFDFSKGLGLFNILNILIFSLIAIYLLVGIIKAKLSISKFLILMVYGVLLPIGASLLAFVNNQIDYHNLMKMGFCVFYIIFILIYENINIENKKLNLAKSWIVFLVSVVLIFSNVLIANVSYHKIGMAYEKSYATLIRIADRIEQTENAENCNKILVIGNLENSEAYSSNLPPDITGTTDGFILRADDETVRQSVVCSALNDYCGEEYQFVAGIEKDNLMKKSEVSNLGIWPQENSVAVVDDVIVLKLSAESE